MEKMLIIGGSDAGISAALRIKEIAPETSVTVMAADVYPNYSICGLPFYISGEVAHWRSLAHRSSREIEQQGIDLLLDHRALAIDPKAGQVRARSAEGQSLAIGYDKLLIATGAESLRPTIEGLDVPGVFFLRWMADSFALHRFMDQRRPQRALVIGGGYIGLEMADALTHKGLKVVLMESAPQVLTTLDPELGGHISAELESRGVQVLPGQAVERIADLQGKLLVHTASGEAVPADMVLVAAGAAPASQLARSAGVETGVRDAIRVDRGMATTVPNIWAAGDCVETWHRILNRPVYMPLGTTAHKQGRVAGANMAGEPCEFQGSLGTQVVKVFDRVAARTGLRQQEARDAGFDPLTAALTAWDHKAYYPGAKELHIHLTADRLTGRLLGAQMVGHKESEVSKRIDIVATALYQGLSVQELCDIDLSYTPPLSSPWDPVQMAAMKWNENSMTREDKQGD